MISLEAFTVDGVHRLEEQGVTDVIVGFRWPYAVGPDTESLQSKLDPLRRFADDVIAKVRRMTTARDLGQASMAAVEASDRQAWLDLFDRDAVVEDPVGPSTFDPEGGVIGGPEAIAAFYDTVIAPNESIRFDISPLLPLWRRGCERRRHPHHLRGRWSAVEVDGVYVYRRSPDGKIASLRAYWEPDAIRTVPCRPTPRATRRRSGSGTESHRAPSSRAWPTPAGRR